jgi:hypothetical protein
VGRRCLGLGKEKVRWRLERKRKCRRSDIDYMVERDGNARKWMVEEGKMVEIFGLGEKKSNGYAIVTLGCKKIRVGNGCKCNISHSKYIRYLMICIKN